MAAAVAATLLCPGTSARIKVACIGNSITYGFTLADPAAESYPTRLQELLGDNYEVGNFGLSRATMLRKGHYPYVNFPQWQQAKQFAPDIAIIHLGVNDTDPRNWPNYADEFIPDYRAMIDTLRSINPDVRILLSRLTPLTASHRRFETGTRDWRLDINRAIEQVALGAGAEVIDLGRELLDRQNLLPDAIHPNAEGARLMARHAAGAVTGNWGGLRLPGIYADSMVMQRDRPLRIAGRADAGETVTLTLDGHRYHTRADRLGDWSVLTAPLATGGPYEMTAETPSRRLTFKDILAGEVWIASGQSNMEFPLASETGGDPVVYTDPQLRFYHLRPDAVTDNSVWSDSLRARVDSLAYYRPARWAKVSPANAPRLSAVAYRFARELRDSLGVPVGIIANAVGGSTTESWIDVTTLEHNLPGALRDWHTNDYTQPWAQGRAMLNAGAGHRHPYGPSYLFAAGIRPLGGYAPRGVIWYQGESNAHNTELHERLFQLLEQSWREYFADDSLPFCMVQLSSINRPSWPMFRDSQRRMADRLPYTYMAVSSDYGDSLDVHPTHKQPVGHRLAAQALHNIYGLRHVVPQGPAPRSVLATVPGTVDITWDHADGLTTADGLAPRTFEIAGSDGMYLAAEARITSDNHIILTNMKISRPRYVRYGWQPFTRANVVNGASLPVSTFGVEVDNAGDYIIEPGLEAGVSAAFAGLAPDGRIVMAGGCNFPVDPLGAASVKKFYSGIYAGRPDGHDIEWKRIGSLPEAMAYGVSVNVPGGIFIAGGTSAAGALRQAALIEFHDGNDRAVVKELPQLPVTVDNAYAAAIGSRIYIAGGNQQGKPSTGLWSIDLSAARPEWKRMANMPGNPRVQPVMAAGRNAAGEDCLWVWGGFAGRHDGHEPSLELDGLCYSPSRNKWTRIDPLTDAGGEPVSVGGGVAVNLSNGMIAVTGGVNKQVFLDALRCQASDYLTHPIDWYRLNGSVMTFDPASARQVSASQSEPDRARAGASAVSDNQGGFYLAGGELKPRIRTAETIHIIP